eukprot:gnl/MRDRNA2_/MRDRNA2_91194_c0_seq1.p1 gnl/MRDRNA2_/MRDRNA2_91194_c0~~gnl/MRDRNA2_/MRDRNA2_91194_c0_seq1.p1  ORF type:complete len:270 (+),score=51.66 gnl/MRDRNA2_/MRDRNA2_91194_c0_seq1:92-811(+)
MTDRFYPKGTQVFDEDALKSTYTAQNEMRSFHRSAYPPGYAGHEPGVREKMGYANPGPHAWRLADPDHALTEDVDNDAPRIMHAAVKSKAHDKSSFHELDLPHYSQKLRHQESQVLPEELRTRTMGRSLSTTRMGMKALSEPRDAITHLEDDRFSYYVPGIYSKKGKDALLKKYDLLKLEKQMKVIGANPGEGTGFRCQGGGTNWWPVLDSDPEISQIQRTYRKPPFHRSVSATALHGF